MTKDEALEESIKHWERHAKCETLGDVLIEGLNETDCALCRLYNNENTDQACKGCPVANKTGKVFCEGSPFMDVCDYMQTRNPALMIYNSGAKFDAAKWQKLAQAEVEFLKSLRVKSPTK